MPPPQPALADTTTLRFGPGRRFEIQPGERRLLVDGQPALLGGRAFDLLLALLARPGQLRSKHELLDIVWPGLVVEEANLQVQVSNLRKLLGGELIATVPGRGYRFVGEVAEVDAARSAVPAPPPSPAITAATALGRLFGRDDDLARLLTLLQRDGLGEAQAQSQAHGVITLVGSAGVGKTSLARVAAASWKGRHTWVDLSALVDGRQLLGALARALNLQLGGDDAGALARLEAQLRGQPQLLVLDNAEHLVEACAGLVSPLAALPGVRLLVTSQVPLGVAGERLLRLQPLSLADSETDLGDGAMALLLARIVAADHRFTLTPAGRAPLRAICEQLDGLPLALEMAAARVPMLGLTGVHEALTQRFSLLTRGHRDSSARHRTLHDALDWSYRLLGADEQALFRALGVFSGGFTLDLVLGLVADTAHDRWAVIDALTQLAERSLLVVGLQDPPRYRLLETLRAYALEQMGPPPTGASEAQAHDSEWQRLHRRLARVLLELFSRDVVGDAAAIALGLAEMENARYALAWLRTHDLALAAQLSIRVSLCATFSLWRHEAGNWLLALEPLMDQPAGLALPRQVQAAWWSERARIGVIRLDSQARIPARRAVALWQTLQQPDELLRALATWVRSVNVAGAELDEACAALQAQAERSPDLAPRDRLRMQGALTRAAALRDDHEAVIAGREAEIVLARELGDHNAADAAESGIINRLLGLRRHAEAAQRSQALLARVDADGSGSNGNLPWVLYGLFLALVELGRLDEARALLPRALVAGRRFSTSVMAPTLAMLAAAEGRWTAAAQLVGHARRAFAEQGSTLSSDADSLQGRVLAGATQALGAEPVAALVQQGQALSTEAAEALALQH